MSLERSPAEAVEAFFGLVIDELDSLRTRAKVEAIEQAADLILECESRGGRVHVTGIGKSEHIARYVASLLSSTGTPAYFLHATECIHGSAGQVCANDVVIAISNSGTTPELLSAVETLREFDTRIIGVSGNSESELARIADVTSGFRCGERRRRVESGSSREHPRQNLCAVLAVRRA